MREVAHARVWREVLKKRAVLEDSGRGRRTGREVVYLEVTAALQAQAVGQSGHARRHNAVGGPDEVIENGLVRICARGLLI